MDLDDRIANLVAATAHPTPIEYELIRGEVVVIAPSNTANPGSSDPPLVMFKSRREAFHKRFCDQDANICRMYRQDRMDVPLNEVAAWRLAVTMGDPWEQLLPTAVLRFLEGKGGALINRRYGDRNVTAAVQYAHGQVMAAAFFDTLIGQQDRNARNFLFDHGSRRLALIDHGFTFARPGDPMNASMFLAIRRAEPGGQTLSPREIDVLDNLLGSGDLHGLTRYLPGDRAIAMEQRAERMRNTRLLLPVTAF